MYEKLIIISSITVLLVLFAFYLVNVITKQESKSKYVYKTYCISDIEEEKNKIEEHNKKTKEIHEQFAINRNIGILIIGVIYMLFYFYFDLENKFNISFILAGIFTILYETSINWAKYSDREKLSLIIIGLITIFDIIRFRESNL